MSNSATRTYHHGNLEQALVHAGLALAREGGPTAVTVRAAARLAGVSAPAAYRHFADREAFLGEVARECRQILADAMITARDVAQHPTNRLLATGRAYIEFGAEFPHLIDCAFSGSTSPRPDDPDAYQVLSGGLDDVVAAGFMTAERRAGAEIIAWSSVHGIAMLLARSPVLRSEAEALADTVLLGVERALGVGMVERTQRAVSAVGLGG